MTSNSTSVPNPKPKLLPCPFCGELVGLVLHKGSENKWGPKLSAVTCVCGISTPRFFTSEEAANWWNRRANRQEAAGPTNSSDD